jgi:hypothetical protein
MDARQSQRGARDSPHYFDRRAPSFVQWDEQSIDLRGFDSSHWVKLLQGPVSIISTHH